MAQPARAHEPSMEEILASIRRIISDDDSQALGDAVSPAASDASDPSIPSHALSSDAAAKPEISGRASPAMSRGPESPPGETSEVRAMEKPSEGRFHEPSAGYPSQSRRRDIDSPTGGMLLSETAAAAVESAFGRLSRTTQIQSARTLEELVREMLRPLLKSWLDENLPALVERLVRAEIERISRARG